VIAAWALGRIGDRHAVLALREGLDNEYRSVRAHCVRALGTLDDQEITPTLLTRLEEEGDEGLRTAYASALGKLGVAAAQPTLLAALRESQDEGSQMELALAAARIVGVEQNFIRLLRQWRSQPGTAAAHAMGDIRKQFVRRYPGMPAIHELCDCCTDRFAREDLNGASRTLCRCIRLLPLEGYSDSSIDLLHECALHMEHCGVRRPEYVLLALHTLAVGNAAR
jgi:hypothetical protein